MEGSAHLDTLPYPHARHDCALCRERDADLRLVDVPDTRESSLLLCVSCFGTHLTFLTLRQSGPGFDQPTTVAVVVIECQHVLDNDPPPHRPCTRWDSATGLAYPHRYNDCWACRSADADLVLVELDHPPALCRRCAAWNIASRAALAEANAEPFTAMVSVAPSRWQDPTETDSA